MGCLETFLDSEKAAEPNRLAVEEERNMLGAGNSV
jgi:hypothetical protein